VDLVSLAKINEYLEKIPAWSLENNGKSIVRSFEFKNFQEAVEFINKIAEIAEEVGHHPDIRLYDYNKVNVLLTTTSLGGLTEKDFDMASRIDSINFSK